MRAERGMRWALVVFCAATLTAGMALPCSAQFGSLIQKAKEKAAQAEEKAKLAREAKDIYTPWSPEQEQQVGEASAATIVNIFGLYENPEMVRYVNLVGDTVAQHTQRPVVYRFGILNTEIITALSVPGGYVFITRGALANMHSEAELAGTLAHEIAHVDERHLEKEIRSKSSMTFLRQQTARFTSTQLEQIAGNVAQGSLTQQYSRDKETDADRIGVTLAQAAGYKADGLRMFLTFLQNAPKTPESQRQLSLWGSTHPPLPARIEALRAQEASLPAGGQVLDARFVKHVNVAAFAAH